MTAALALRHPPDTQGLPRVLLGIEHPPWPYSWTCSLRHARNLSETNGRPCAVSPCEEGVWHHARHAEVTALGMHHHNNVRVRNDPGGVEVVVRSG